MTALYLVFVFTLVNVLKDTAGTVCSDAYTEGTIVLNMCEDGHADGNRVLIDTYGSSVYRKDGGSINCSCTATMTGPPNGTSTTVIFEPVQSLHPPTGCESSVIVSTQRAAFPDVSSEIYVCAVETSFLLSVQTNDTITVVWQSGVSGSTSGFCLSLRTALGYSLSTKCFTIASQRETTTQLKEATAQSKETTSQSRETTTTTKSSITTTHSRETTTNKGTSAGATTERQNCVHQNDLQQCYPLSAVIVPLVVTSLLITITVVVHFILYRKRLAIVKNPENTGTMMTSQNSVDYDSLDLSRVEPPNLYSDTSTGHMYINTAVES